MVGMDEGNFSPSFSTVNIISIIFMFPVVIAAVTRVSSPQ